MNLDKKLNELIKESLPEKVGAELREVLARAEHDKKHLKEATIANEKACKQIDSYLKTISDLEKLLSEHEEISKRVLDVETREKALEIEVLKIKLNESEKRATMVQDFTSGLVRNTLVRKTIFDSDSIDEPIRYDNNGHVIGGGMKNVTKNYDETEIKE